jgi:hypothetical protein
MSARIHLYRAHIGRVILAGDALEAGLSGA